MCGASWGSIQCSKPKRRNSLSLRDVELILAERRIVVSYESIREWGIRFGRMFATALKRRRPRLGDKWHLDGMSRTHFRSGRCEAV